MKSRIEELTKKIKIKFKDENILRQALTHRSYLNEHRDKNIDHNERLEFLGDAVLELVVTKYLFDNFINKPEGELTNLRAALVKGENLTKVAKDLNLGSYLFLSRGESKAGGRSRSYILANAMEALIGAIYLDQGYKKAQDFIIKNIIKELSVIIEEQLFRDPKSMFQEKAQEVVRVTPNYKLISQSGPDHDKFFIVGVYLNEKLIAKGDGRSKQEAQQSAASKAMKKKSWK